MSTSTSPRIFAHFFHTSLFFPLSGSDISRDSIIGTETHYLKEVNMDDYDPSVNNTDTNMPYTLLKVVDILQRLCLLIWYKYEHTRE